MSRLLITAAALAATLAMAAPAAVADPELLRSGNISGTSINYGIFDNGQTFFLNSSSPNTGFQGWMSPVGAAFMGRTTMRSSTSNDATFYRPDMNLMIDLETGAVCWGVGTPQANCK